MKNMERNFMKHNKKQFWWESKYLVGIIVTFCIIFAVQTGEVLVSAAANVELQSIENRISIDCDDLYINQKTVIRITLKDRTNQEDLSVSPELKDIVRIQSGKWRGDQKTLVIIPLKPGKVILNIALKTNNTKNQQPISERKIKVTVKARIKMEPKEIYENCEEAMVEIITFDSMNSRNLGSGFFISGNEVVTNYHVIQEASKLIICDYRGKTYTVTHIVDYNKAYDLAILQVAEESQESLILNMDTVKTGETVYSLGSPIELSGTLSEGMVSKANRQYENISYHQSTAYISKNSGGGPLLNEYGEVIGVNTLMILGNQNIYLAMNIQYISLLDRKNPKPIDVLYEENKGKVKEQVIYITIP